jgi:hypothetical protein
MNFREDTNGLLKPDQELEQTLEAFRSNVHAWSEAAYNMPHKPVKVYNTSWRVVSGWALGCFLAVSSLAGGLYGRYQMKEQARIAAEAAVRQQKLEMERHITNEDLLAKVDSDVSRDVPSAMEPLAQLMAEDSEQ